MGLKEREYSVLLVSAAGNLAADICALINEGGGLTAETCSSITSAKRVTTERDFDFVIINLSHGDEAGVRFACDLCGRPDGIVPLILVRKDLHDEIYSRVSLHGVFTLPKPTSRTAMATALMWMASARERLRRGDSKMLSINEKMEEIRKVNKAKWLLISALKIGEPEAHRYIEKSAMDRCITKRQAAEEIIEKYGSK